MIDKEIIAVFHYDDKGSKCCGSEPYRYAEELVRCKECKHSVINKHDRPFCKGWERTIKHDDFCSYGERKESE